MVGFFRYVLSVPAVLLVGACTSQTELDHRQALLDTAMDQCLANQAQDSQQLANQQEQLGEMMTQLALIQRDLQAINAPAEPDHAEEKPIQACLPAIASSEEAATKLVVGQREQIWLQDLQLKLPARIDTGAETASLDARNIELFERNSRRWVKFEILHPQSEEPIALERKLVRMALIIQANSMEPERRPVIKLGITLGHISQSAEFTLSNRSHLDYQMLIGRNILQDVMVVDVSQQNIAPFVEPVAAAQADRDQP